MHAKRQRLLLSTAALMGALTGYGRSAHAICVGIIPNFVCSGANITQQDVTSANATVTTVPNFSVVTGDAFGVRVTGAGDLSFNDTNGSTILDAGTSGLFVIGDIGSIGDPGSIIINTEGTITGGSLGIHARNYSSGATSVTANGDVTGTSGSGILAENGTAIDPAGSDLTVTTADGTTVGGDGNGISAFNFGSGSLLVTANGDLYGTTGIGIAAQNGNNATPTGINLTVITDTGTDVEGGDRGISVNNQGSGTTSVTANGDVTGGDFGIFGQNRANGGEFTVITGAGTEVEGGTGISAINIGAGALNITANGDVTGNNTDGINAQNGSGGVSAGTDLNVTTAANTIVRGGQRGIDADNFGDGALNITVNGDVTGDTNDGIDAQNSATATDINVATAANTTVAGDDSGIYARNAGSGAINIIVEGDVIGTRNDGINARHAGGGSINITVGTSATVTSNGGDVIPDFAIDTFEGPADVTVAGTLNGGGGGAVRFDGLDDRLELRTTAAVNGNVLARGGSDTLAFAGSGNGSFNLANIDDGTNTRQYQDFEDFIVESATWTMNGVTAADFLVVGGTLKGNGTFGSLTVNNGTLSPGNSFGTMTVNGIFSLNPGAIFEVEVNAANQGDLVVVNGTVNLTGATLRILAAPGDYKLETDYVIIDNDGTDAVNGVFGAVTSTLAFLIPTVAYDGGTGNDVVLTLTRNDVDPCDVANTGNQSAACNAIDEDNPLFDEILRQTAAGARQAFDALSGEVHASAAGVMADDNRYVREAILGRLMQASHAGEALSAGGPQVASLDDQAYALGYDGKSLIDEPRHTPLAFWTRAYGAWGTYDGDGNAATADRNLGGFMSGMDADVGGNWRAGLTTGASFSNIDVDARFSAADVESYYLGAYTGGMAGAFALRGGGTWAWSDIDTSRAVVFPGFFERQKASYDADTGQLFGEVAYPTQMGGIALESFGGIAYVSLDADTFVERGGPLASLRGLGIDQGVGYTTLGVRAATSMIFGGMQVVPHISARWLHAFDDVTPSAALAFATTGAAFTVEGVPLAEDSALLDAGLDFAVGPNTTAGVSYSGQYADNVIDNGVKGRFTWLF